MMLLAVLWAAEIVAISVILGLANSAGIGGEREPFPYASTR
jgi:hypothetical protein